MLKKLKPDYYYQSIFVIDLDMLKREGIKGVICDIDNTIVPWSEEEILKEVIDWFQDLQDRDLDVCLVSNGTERRVSFFSQGLDLPAVGRAIKPAKKAFKEAQEILGLKRKEIVVIGDQLFTDVLGGNRMGFKTVLVDPLSKEEFITTKFMRNLEKLFFQRGG